MRPEKCTCVSTAAALLFWAARCHGPAAPARRTAPAAAPSPVRDRGGEVNFWHAQSGVASEKPSMSYEMCSFDALGP